MELLISSVSPIVGNLLEMSPSEIQACFERNRRFVAGLKYIICLVMIVDPSEDSPEIRTGRAPNISMPLLLAAVIFMVTGMRCFL